MGGNGPPNSLSTPEPPVPVRGYDPDDVLVHVDDADTIVLLTAHKALADHLLLLASTKLVEEFATYLVTLHWKLFQTGKVG